MNKQEYTEQFLYAAWNYQSEDIQAGLNCETNIDLYDHFTHKLRDKQSRYGGSHGLLAFLFDLSPSRKQAFIKAFTWSYLVRNAMSQVSYGMLVGMAYGDEVELNHGFKVYHYTEDDVIVLQYETDDDLIEVATVLIDDDKESLIFEMC